jgi:hypothetical protein
MSCFIFWFFPGDGVVFFVGGFCAHSFVLYHDNQSFISPKRKEHPLLGGSECSISKGNGRNVHVQTKGVYVCYVIYFTSLPYHKIIIASTIHNEFHMTVTLDISTRRLTLYLHSNMLLIQKSHPPI